MAKILGADRVIITENALANQRLNNPGSLMDELVLR